MNIILDILSAGADTTGNSIGSTFISITQIFRFVLKSYSFPRICITTPHSPSRRSNENAARTR